MRYVSTRGECPPHGFSEAVSVGLAPDGGLFLPEELPDLSGEWGELAGLPYAELCFRFLRRFATDIPAETLRGLVERSYRRFPDAGRPPLVKLDERTYMLELFHGPTLAFKDFALQLLGNLYEHLCSLSGERIHVLGATSGDTGAAAIHGLLGKANTAVFILYPEGRVSPLQERQMACTGAANVHALAITGTFDDAQAALKEVFGDAAFRRRYHLSAVNSINLARILAQSVYYLDAWLRLPPAVRETAEFAVPTGNFGNILAGWMLRQMGIPIARFRVATNRNDILFRLFTTGEYRVGEVYPSLAPSMDIQVASNFERYLYYAEGGDATRVRQTMASLRRTGSHRLECLDREAFRASRTPDEAIPGIIRSVHERYGYIVDPHTACGFQDLPDDRPSVLLATASPAKFPDTIRESLGIEPTDPTLEQLKSLPIVKVSLPADPEAIKAFIAAHALV